MCVHDLLQTLSLAAAYIHQGDPVCLVGHQLAEIVISNNWGTRFFHASKAQLKRFDALRILRHNLPRAFTVLFQIVGEGAPSEVIWFMKAVAHD